MNIKQVTILGAGLAGSEAALQLANRGMNVKLIEMRPTSTTPVHKTGDCAELVCSNSLKSTKVESAAGMLKKELKVLGSCLYEAAQRNSVAAGGALAVNRDAFSRDITKRIEGHSCIEFVKKEAVSLDDHLDECQALLVATGPLTSNAMAQDIMKLTGSNNLAFFDAAAPIVMADSLNFEKLFRQSRYEDSSEGQGDYLNAPFSRPEYDEFIEELINAERVIKKDFETGDLFQACQPIEEIARKGHDAPRFGTLKPVGLTDPRTQRRPWAALQLRAEDDASQSFNLVGFQTNLTFSEQKRVFRMIPGLENAEFARYGVMHRNTFINAPQMLNESLRLITQHAQALPIPIFMAGQLTGTEGYCEAIRSGLHASLSIAACLKKVEAPRLSKTTAFGSLMAYATNPETKNYQPMHVNFGIFEPLEKPIRNKKERYASYAQRGEQALFEYVENLRSCSLI